MPLQGYLFNVSSHMLVPYMCERSGKVYDNKWQNQYQTNNIHICEEVFLPMKVKQKSSRDRPQLLNQTSVISTS